MTLAGICEVARKSEPCSVCRAGPGEPCHDPGGTHLCRVLLTADHGSIPLIEAVSVMHDMDVFTGASLVLDAAS